MIPTADFIFDLKKEGPKRRAADHTGCFRYLGQDCCTVLDADMLLIDVFISSLTDQSVCQCSLRWLIAPD